MSGPEAQAYVTEAVESREDRARRLRPDVAQAVAALGLHAVAARTGLSTSAVRTFVDGFVTPLPGSLDAYEEMLKKLDAPEHGAGQDGDPRSRRPTDGAQMGGAILVSGG